MSSKLIIFFLIPFHVILSTANSPTDFIKTECQSTLYPSLCVQCLSTHSSTIQQNPKQLIITALSVSLSRAQSVARFIATTANMRGLTPTEYRAVKDCADNMANAIDQLSRSVKEIAGVPLNFSWRVNNIVSWVGAAVTFHYTCLDGFLSPAMDANVKVAVRGRVVECAHVTSNSLALVHGFAARHKKLGTKVP